MIKNFLLKFFFNFFIFKTVGIFYCLVQLIGKFFANRKCFRRRGKTAKRNRIYIRRESESRHRGDSFRSSSVIDTPEAMKVIKDTGVLSVYRERMRERERKREREGGIKREIHNGQVIVAARSRRVI